MIIKKPLVSEHRSIFFFYVSTYLREQINFGDVCIIPQKHTFLVIQIYFTIYGILTSIIQSKNWKEEYNFSIA